MKPDSLMRGPVFRIRGAVVRHSSAVCVVAAAVKYKWSKCGMQIEHQQSAPKLRR